MERSEVASSGSQMRPLRHACRVVRPKMRLANEHAQQHSAPRALAHVIAKPKLVPGAVKRNSFPEARRHSRDAPRRSPLGSSLLGKTAVILVTGAPRPTR